MSGDIESVISNAAKGTLLPVYLIGGDERLLVQRCVDAIRHATVGAGPRGLAEDHFDGKGLSASVLMSAARTLPMMARHRLVIVRGVDQMGTAEQEALIAYFAKPEPRTVLVLVALQLDLRRRIANEAKKNGFLFVAQHPKEGEIGPWITREAARRRLQLDPGAVESLALLVGPDLSLLSDALDRLSLYAYARAITADDVEQCITPVREIAAWDLSDAVTSRNLASGLAVLGRLLAQRQPALPLLAVISRQIYQLAKAKQFLASGEKGSLAAALGAPPSAAQKVAAQAKHWSPQQLARALKILAATDSALKGARRGDERVLEECLIALAGGPGMGELADPRRPRGA